MKCLQENPEAPHRSHCRYLSLHIVAFATVPNCTITIKFTFRKTLSGSLKSLSLVHSSKTIIKFPPRQLLQNLTDTHQKTMQFTLKLLPVKAKVDPVCASLLVAHRKVQASSSRRSGMRRKFSSEYNNNNTRGRQEERRYCIRVTSVDPWAEFFRCAPGVRTKASWKFVTNSMHKQRWCYAIYNNCRV